MSTVKCFSFAELVNTPRIDQSKRAKTGYPRVLTSNECIKAFEEKEEQKRLAEQEKLKRKTDRELKKDRKKRRFNGRRKKKLARLQSRKPNSVKKKL